ncbi:hypothetical protein FISHEDRAFT_59123 [Fistulina hepatica ATCC 64428]|uniref:Uncharacterized protein n=1 Tax=Fistulina hepatica ATCC 64428 TaxID=1128425 RepID=A0A0D7ABH1_9AGAR|nr:hypothetical protein FISHEDRAFT_59123 [Fistulina hepatica ATCC 64428]
MCTEVRQDDEHGECVASSESARYTTPSSSMSPIYSTQGTPEPSSPTRTLRFPTALDQVFPSAKGLARLAVHLHYPLDEQLTHDIFYISKLVCPLISNNASILLLRREEASRLYAFAFKNVDKKGLRALRASLANHVCATEWLRCGQWNLACRRVVVNHRRRARAAPHFQVPGAVFGDVVNLGARARDSTVALQDGVLRYHRVAPAVRSKVGLALVQRTPVYALPTQNLNVVTCFEAASGYHLHICVWAIGSVKISYYGRLLGVELVSVRLIIDFNFLLAATGAKLGDVSKFGEGYASNESMR